MSSRMFLDHTWKELAAKKTTSSRATLRLRARGYSYLIFGGELFLTAGREQSILMTVLNEFEQRGPVILRGQSASAGLTMGEARVIQGGRADGIRRGQVLVIEDANQLDTRWLKTAVAVVANQGGILSKAASYAREMGIPCVTGTVNATEAVRDGDLLEVDGNTGICAIRRQRPSAGTLM
jgi:pyruvate,water dikinase